MCRFGLKSGHKFCHFGSGYWILLVLEKRERMKVLIQFPQSSKRKKREKERKETYEAI